MKLFPLARWRGRPSPSVLAVFFLLALTWTAAAAGEADADGGIVAPADVWAGLAGRIEESEAEGLELRDELIAANLAFLSALEKAAVQAADLSVDDPLYPLAWARVEYLAEASFRLLVDTGEYEAFLKTTASLILAPTPRPEMPPLELGDGDSVDADDGLLFEDAAGRRLLPALIDGTHVLIDAETAEVVRDNVGVTARSSAEGDDVAVSEPLVQARVTWLRCLAMERLGRIEAAATEAASLGMVRDWLLLGSLDRDLEFLSGATAGMDYVVDALDPDFVIVGKNGPVRWRSFSSVDPLGRVFAEAAFGNDSPAMAYALTLIYSETDQPAVIRFGSSGPATLWVNHSQTSVSSTVGLAMPSQEAFSVWFRKGWNVVTVKTLSDPRQWLLTMRVVSSDGSPFAGCVAPVASSDMSRLLRVARAAVEKSVLDRYYVPDHPPELGGLSALSKHLAVDSDDARANFYLGSLLAAKRLMEGAERFDRELIFRRAIELSEGDPYFILIAARSVEAGVEGPDREENLRLILLRLAAERGSAAALVDIGRLYLDVMRQPRRAEDYAQRAQGANPMSLRAGILRHDVAADRGWGPNASAILERLGQRHPAAAAVRLRLGQSALKSGRFRDALSEFYALLGIDAENDVALHGAVTALVRLGQTSAALDLLRKRITSFPYDLRARLRLIDLYRNLGREDEAMTDALAMLAVNPDNAAALAARNDIVRNGRAASAARETPAVDDANRRAGLDFFDPGMWIDSVVPPPGGWEYLIFQLEDEMERNGVIVRRLSFAVKVYNDQACAALRGLDFGLAEGLDSGTVEKLALVHIDGSREELTPPRRGGAENGFAFRLPPLVPGDIILAAIEIQRGRIPFLGDYFGQVIPLGQLAPVRLSRYMFTAPRERRLFFQPANGAPQAMMVETPDHQGFTRIWEMNDLPAYPEEPHGPGRNSVMPCIQVSSFAAWDEFARWYWRLVGAQYHAPPELRLLAGRVAGNGDNSPLARLDRAADWIAENLGDREWEFGLYAFRPISVRTILSRRTADGKDRTLLLCLLAREYGLEAWPVLARSWEVWRQLPGLDLLGLPLLDHFNYSLAVVDAKAGGQVFLDASNPDRPAGVMPTNLFGAPAVRLTPDGAELLVIPDGGLSGCAWDETAEAVVDPDGSILWEEKVNGSGLAAEALRSRFESAESRETAWEEFLAGAGGQSSTVAAEFENSTESPATAFFSGRARLREFASVNQRRAVLRLPPLPGRMAADGNYEFPVSLAVFAGLGERAQDLLLPGAFRLSRRIGVSYPPEWRLVNPPQSFRRAYPFGTVVLQVAETTGGIEFNFVMEIPERRIAAPDYAAFRQAAAVAEAWRRPLLVWEKR